MKLVRIGLVCFFKKLKLKKKLYAGVLTKMLKEAQEKNKRAILNNESPSASNSPKEQQLHQLEASIKWNNEHDATLAQLDAVTQKLTRPPYSPPLSSRPLIGM